MRLVVAGLAFALVVSSAAGAEPVDTKRLHRDRADPAAMVEPRAAAADFIQIPIGRDTFSLLADGTNRAMSLEDLRRDAIWRQETAEMLRRILSK